VQIRNITNHIATAFHPDDLEYTVDGLSADPEHMFGLAYDWYAEVARKEPAAALCYCFGYRDWRFPLEACQAMRRRGVLPIILTLAHFDYATMNPLDRIENIAAGGRDEVIRRLARDAKSYGGPLLMALDWEVGNLGSGPDALDGWGWSTNAAVLQKANPSAVTLDGKEWPASPATYVRAMRRWIDLFREEGADNVSFLFETCPKWPTYPDWAAPKWWYPGRDYIDWVGGYAGFSSAIGVTTFKGAVEPLLRDIAEIDGADDKPFFLEICGSEDPNDPDAKARYYEEAFTTAAHAHYPRLTDYGLMVEDWCIRVFPADPVYGSHHIDSSPQTRAAYRAGIGHSIYSSHLNVEPGNGFSAAPAAPRPAYRRPFARPGRRKLA
jgi:hypothetical protein